MTEIKAFKGFNRDMTCRGFQYKEGESYKYAGKVVKCTSGGFHSCENPLDIFNYYNPAESIFYKVDASGAVDCSGDDTKIASAEITIRAEIKLPELIDKSVAWIMAKVDVSNSDICKDDKSHASNTGYQSAASNTGDRSAAEVSGDASIAMACGINSKAKASKASAIVLAFRDDDGELVHVRAAIIDGINLKADVWYTLNSQGVFEEVSNDQNNR